jgi:lipopolysaccharide transport system ATP-binding protein
MHSEIAISVRDLAKTYRIFGHPGDRIKHAAFFGMRRYHKEFAALKGISFDIRKGESVGLIGRNGSGKSTLLQLICGILKPTAGAVRVNGSVSALLELGAGFNPEFTGRENVYFQGALMGFRKEEMDARFDDIAALADIGEFIDQPVRTYSSGMYVRLAFSVAVSAKPEVLIIDEALSVGDAVFQHKSKKKIEQLKEQGTSLLLVSHDRNVITGMCRRCLLLDGGKLVLDAEPGEAMERYYAAVSASTGQQVLHQPSNAGRLQTVSGTGEASVERIRLLDSAGKETEHVATGEAVVLELHVRVDRSIPRLVCGFMIRDQFGQAIYGINANSFDKALLDVRPGSRYVFRYSLPANLGEGTYSISTALVSTNDRFTNNYECRDLAHFFSVHNRLGKPFGGVAWLDTQLEVDES